RWLVRLGNAYVELFRNIPLLVQMFLWYFVLPELLPSEIGDWLKQLPDASFYTAVVALGFYTSARIAEQVRAGILSLARGQGWAALALGLTLPQAYAYVLLPMAFRIILPPLTSEFLNVIKNSAVALTIGLMELTARARAMQEFSFQVFEAFTAATVIYIVINIIVTFAMRWLERETAVPGYISGAERPIQVGAFTSSLVTFTLFEAAYFCEIMRAGIQSIPRGQVAASLALGMTYAQTMGYVVLPQAFRNMLPVLLTQTIILFQDTSLVYVLSATDFLGAASKIANRDYRLVEMYSFVAIVYFVMSYGLSTLVRRLQQRIAIIR